ncbi:MAG: aminopeptidase P N-terminal domain-containing protein [Bacteroidota bacterium]
MKYHPIGNQLFTLNRDQLQSQLDPKSVAIIHSNDILPTNADGVLPFRQNNNLFYLTGADQEESILLLAPDFPDEKFREILFLRETDENIAVWEGHKLTKEEATEISGIETVMWKDQFELTLYTVLAESETIYLDTNEHIRTGTETETRSDRFVKWCMNRYPLYQYKRLAPLLQEQRMIKSYLEIKTLQHACDITEKGFRRILNSVSPGVWEYEIEAEYIHEFVRNRSRGFAYDPIIASGANACVLHYITNNEQCKDGDLLLMDVGAEYGNYNADMTRTIPVNGRFTQRQRAVYDAVLHVKTEATELLRPGTTIKEYHEEVGRIMEGQLISLGLLHKHDVEKQDPKNPLYRKYFMHGTSHFLGLDVHDVGSFYQPIAEGMVFTVEPGIYIREEDIGIRLEDNIVVTKDGHINLMKNIPLHAEEIEDLMNK